MIRNINHSMIKRSSENINVTALSFSHSFENKSSLLWLASITILTIVFILGFSGKVFADTVSRVPTSDIVTGWTAVFPSSPVTHYDKVDDPIGTPDDDSTYVTGNNLNSAPGNTDIYGYTAFGISAGSTITSVAVTIRAREEVNFNSNTAPVIRVGGTDYRGTGQNPGNTNYYDYTETWNNNPATGSPWTVAQVNAIQGFGVNSQDNNPTMRVTQVYITVTYTPPTATTTVGDGAALGNATLPPGGAATMLDAFSLQTSSGSDIVTAITVTLAAGTSAGIGLVEITNTTGVTVYGSVSNPASDTVNISLGTTITATTTLTQYRVRITPKSHAAMPAPPGSTYTVTGTVTSIASTNPKVYNDTMSGIITIDNLSPNNATWGVITPGNGQVVLNWSNPGGDFSQVVILRSTAAISDAPAEGATYVQNDTIGSSIVRYVGSGTTFTDTGLTNGQPYYYKIFAKDTSGNYAVGLQTGPHTPTGPATTTVGDGTSPANKSVNQGATNRAVSTFTLSTSSGTDTVTSIVVRRGGTGTAADVSSVKIYRDNNNDNEWDAGDLLIGTETFSGTDATFNALGISVNTTSVKYLITYDIAAGAINGNTLTGYVLSVTATNPVTNNDNADATLTVTAGCITAAPTVSITPSLKTITADGGTAKYFVYILNNDSVQCSGTTNFTLVPTDSNLANFNASTFNINPVTLAAKANTTVEMTVRAKAGQPNGSVNNTYVTAQAAGHANGVSNSVTTTINVSAGIGMGNGMLLKRTSEQMCSSCHKTDSNARTDTNSIKMHSAEWVGTCSDGSIENRTDCIGAGQTWTSKWGAAGWGITGGQYGVFQCTTCHTTHNTANIYLIKEAVTAPSGSFPGSAVDFRTLSGNPGDPGTMGDDSVAHNPSTKVCEVCHSQNSYHNSNRALNSDNAHNNASDCTGCHSHKVGFNAGESKGGADCRSCHKTIWDGMTGAVAKVTKHSLAKDTYLDDAVAWNVNNFGSVNPAANRSCVNMCHQDHIHNQPPAGTTHNYNVHEDSSTNATRAVTRDAGGKIIAGTPNRTDFSDAATNGGLCLSCHRNAVDASHPAISKSEYNSSAHNYINFSTYGAWQYTLHDGSVFDRNCTKCHSDRNDSRPGDNTTPFGSVHFADYQSLLAGSTNPNGTPGTFICYNCHGNGTTGQNYSGKNLATEFAKTYKHDVNADNKHNTISEATGNTNYSGANRHVSCFDCHEPHRATAANPMRGATGVSPTNGTAGSTPTFPANASAVTDADLQYQVCFKCHTNWAGFGTGSNVSIAFNPANDSFHWVEKDKYSYTVNTGTGKGIWQNAEFNLNAVPTQGTRTYVEVMMPRSGFTYTNANLRTLSLRCSDCHGANNADGGNNVPEGPHGSTVAMILKIPAGSPYTAWSSTTRYSNNNAWCFNCHTPTFNNTGMRRGGNNLHSLHGNRAPNEGGECQDCHLPNPHGQNASGTANQRKHLLNPSVFREGADSETSGNWNQHGSWVIPGCT